VLVETDPEGSLDSALQFLSQATQLTAHVLLLVERNYSHAKFVPRFAQVMRRREGDARPRLLAALWLGSNAGAQTIASLTPGLEDSDTQVRLAAALALARAGERERTVPALLELLTKPEVQDAPEGWIALGLTKDPRAKEALVKALEGAGPKASMRHIKVIEALGLQGDRDPLPRIRKFFFAREDALRDAAFFAAAALGDPVARRRFLRRVDEFVKASPTARPGYAGNMVAHLGRIKGAESLAILQAVLKGSDPILKLKAVSALEDMRTAEAVDLIVGAMDDASTVGGMQAPLRAVREAALKSAGRAAPKSFSGSLDEQIAAWKAWWRAEGRQGHRNP
jgi:HEAT repeat protein